MKKPRKTVQPRKYEAHIYMDREEYEALKTAADKHLRSINSQAVFYIRQGLAAEQ